MHNELVEILDIESSTPLSWFDWWNYWQTFIGILVFVTAFILLTMSYYSIGTPKNEIQVYKKTQDVDQLVTDILSQKRLTL